MREGRRKMNYRVTTIEFISTEEANVTIQHRNGTIESYRVDGNGNILEETQATEELRRLLAYELTHLPYPVQKEWFQ